MSDTQTDPFEATDYGTTIHCDCGEYYDSRHANKRTALNFVIGYCEWGMVDGKPACRECFSAHLDTVCGEAN